MRLTWLQQKRGLVIPLHRRADHQPAQMESGMEVKQRMVAEKLTVSELVTTQLLALPPVVQVPSCKHTTQAFHAHQSFSMQHAGGLPS